MTQRMKILGLRIKHYRQFKNFYLDLTEPNSDQALAQVCLIGANGTGKSSLLNLVSSFLQNSRSVWLETQATKLQQFVSHKSAIAICLQLDSQKIWILKHYFNDPVILADALIEPKDWISF
ncbi:MAG: AAA family ATPase, partial [Cyanobacteria bacterium J06642_11]